MDSHVKPREGIVTARYRWVRKYSKKRGKGVAPIEAFDNLCGGLPVVFVREGVDVGSQTGR
jgi:hypothetical protein